MQFHMSSMVTGIKKNPARGTALVSFQTKDKQKKEVRVALLPLMRNANTDLLVHAPCQHTGRSCRAVWLLA